MVVQPASCLNLCVCVCVNTEIDRVVSFWCVESRFVLDRVWIHPREGKPFPGSGVLDLENVRVIFTRHNTC